MSAPAVSLNFLVTTAQASAYTVLSRVAMIRDAHLIEITATELPRVSRKCPVNVLVHVEGDQNAVGFAASYLTRVPGAVVRSVEDIPLD